MRHELLQVGGRAHGAVRILALVDRLGHPLADAFDTVLVRWVRRQELVEGAVFLGLLHPLLTSNLFT